MKTNILKSILVSSSIAVVLSSSLFANEEFIVHGVSEVQLNNIKVSSSKNIEEYRFNLQTALEKNGYLLSRVEHYNNNVYVDLGAISDIKIVGIKSSNKEMVTRYVSTLKQNDIDLSTQHHTQKNKSLSNLFF